MTLGILEVKFFITWTADWLVMLSSSFDATVLGCDNDKVFIIHFIFNTDIDDFAY